MSIEKKSEKLYFVLVLHIKKLLSFDPFCYKKDNKTINKVFSVRSSAHNYFLQRATFKNLGNTMKLFRK